MQTWIRSQWSCPTLRCSREVEFVWGANDLQIGQKLVSTQGKKAQLCNVFTLRGALCSSRPVRSCSKETEDGRRTRRHWTDLRNKTQSPELILWCEEQSNNPDWFDVNQSDITRLPIRQCHMLTVRAAADVCSYYGTHYGPWHVTGSWTLRPPWPPSETMVNLDIWFHVLVEKPYVFLLSVLKVFSQRQQLWGIIKGSVGPTAALTGVTAAVHVTVVFPK